MDQRERVIQAMADFYRETKDFSLEITLDYLIESTGFTENTLGKIIYDLKSSGFFKSISEFDNYPQIMELSNFGKRQLNL